jgi:hypothetical protein
MGGDDLFRQRLAAAPDRRIDRHPAPHRGDEADFFQTRRPPSRGPWPKFCLEASTRSVRTSAGVHRAIIRVGAIGVSEIVGSPTRLKGRRDPPAGLSLSHYCRRPCARIAMQQTDAASDENC